MKNTRLSLLAYLTRSDLERRNAGTIGGVFYVLFSPLILIFVMWVALDFGLGMRALVGPSFGIQVVIGMTIWVTFSAAIADSTYSITGSPHLVKKVLFPVELLPIATVFAAFFVHIIILLFVILGLKLSGFLNLQAVWLLPIAAIWLLAISIAYALIFSSLNVVLKDTQVFVHILVGIWFWLTPIIWQVSSIPEEWGWTLGLNPIAGPIEFYKCVLLGTEFSLNNEALIIASSITFILIFSGVCIFRLLRPSFADKL